MAPESRRIDTTVARRLFDEGYQFHFFQAVRLLERLYPDRSPVGYFADPAADVACFGADPSSSFPPSDIQEIVPAEGRHERIRMIVAFMGLTGPKGVLPRHYTSCLLQRAWQNDEALRTFFDLFNHRCISFFYRSWVQAHPPIAYEQARHQQWGYDHFSQSVLALSGARSQQAANTQDIADETLMYYAGLLGRHPRSSSALTSMLSDYFGVPVAVHQCVGRWVEIPEEDRTRLGAHRANNGLGGTMILGTRAWHQQASFRLRVGPLSLDQYCRFLPPGDVLRPLAQLTRLFAGHDRSFEVQLVLKSTDVPPCRLGATGYHAPRLGWSTWLTSATLTYDPDDVILSDCVTAAEPSGD
jgi:type VI secretion system protein ImpH